MILLAAAAAPVLAACAYLFVLTLASRRREAPAGEESVRFDVVVPAHDEESGIARTVRSLLAVDYPSVLRRVIVVADNCTDATAARASEAGATVLVRSDPERRGKGYALAFAFDRCDADAVVVIDADTVVSPNLLRAFAARLQAGALAVQSASAVSNRDDSWRTRLMSLALALFNGVRSLGRDRLGLSCGLRGNGMCLSMAMLRTHPPRAFSLVEDLEYGIALGRAGVRVHFAPEAFVASEMVPKGSVAQRRRWEGGRARLARQLALPLLRDAIRTRSAMLLDLALDLLVPPLSKLALAIAIGLSLSLALGAPLWPWLLCAALLAVHVARGWQLSGVRLRDLACVPAYVFWKLFAVRRAPPQEWQRTERKVAVE
ncbi:MAG: glycosyltransferase family 2 protein [Myxococcales bacterium]|nr:glycosyltransferase family 2 protein [Myxococcales bacterium]